MTRKALSQRGVIEVLIRQGAVIPCGICRLAFKLEDVPFIERGHERCQHTFADEDLEDWDAIDRQRYVHGRNDPRHPSCHAAETARDRKIRDKSARLAKKEAAHRDRIAGIESEIGDRDGDITRVTYAELREAGGKIRSRGFPDKEERKAVKERYAR